jgi:hypothetical protein
VKPSQAVLSADGVVDHNLIPFDDHPNAPDNEDGQSSGKTTGYVPCVEVCSVSPCLLMGFFFSANNDMDSEMDVTSVPNVPPRDDDISIQDMTDDADVSLEENTVPPLKPRDANVIRYVLHSICLCSI